MSYLTVVFGHVPDVPSALSRVFEHYSKTSLVSVAEGFFVVFKGTVELLRLILAIF